MNHASCRCSTPRHQGEAFVFSFGTLKAPPKSFRGTLFGIIVVIKELSLPFVPDWRLNLCSVPAPPTGAMDFSFCESPPLSRPGSKQVLGVVFAKPIAHYPQFSVDAADPMMPIVQPVPIHLCHSLDLDLRPRKEQSRTFTGTPYGRRVCSREVRRFALPFLRARFLTSNFITLSFYKFGCGDGIRTRDLLGMNQTSYRCSTPLRYFAFTLLIQFGHITYLAFLKKLTSVYTSCSSYLKTVPQ